MNDENEEEQEKIIRTIDIKTLEEDGFEFKSGENIKLIITESDEGIS